MFSKNAEVRVAQSKLDSLQAEFEQKTAQLLADQEATLEADAKTVQAAIAQQQKVLTATKESVNEAELELSAVRTGVESAQYDLKAVLQDIEIAQDNLVETRKQQKQSEELIDEAKQKLSTAELTVSRLSTEENRLLDSIHNREGQLASLEQQLVKATTAFDNAKTDREKNLRQLDATLLRITQEIEQKAADEESTRKKLAEWSQELEAKDQNLRIREIKVEAEETKMLNNSSLLNL